MPLKNTLPQDESVAHPRNVVAKATTHYTLDLCDGVRVENASRERVKGLILWTGEFRGGQVAKIFTLAPIGDGIETMLGSLFAKSRLTIDDYLVIAASENVCRAIEVVGRGSDIEAMDEGTLLEMSDGEEVDTYGAAVKITTPMGRTYRALDLFNVIREAGLSVPAFYAGPAKDGEE